MKEISKEELVRYLRTAPIFLLEMLEDSRNPSKKKFVLCQKFEEVNCHVTTRQAYFSSCI